jgi:hypothetical protein
MALNHSEPYLINELTVRLTNRRLITLDPDRISSLQYLLHDFWQEQQHPLADELPLIRSPPSTILAIVFVYWLLVRVLLPRLMHKRAPFDLRSVMLLHNSFLIGLNGIGVLVSLYISRFMWLTWSCRADDFRNIPAWQYRINAYLGYFYFLSKLLDFVDTFFFVLRKRYNQASFLHVFHHGLMPFASYLGLKFVPYFYSGTSFFLFLLSSILTRLDIRNPFFFFDRCPDNRLSADLECVGAQSDVLVLRSVLCWQRDAGIHLVEAVHDPDSNGPVHLHLCPRPSLDLEPELQLAAHLRHSRSCSVRLLLLPLLLVLQSELPATSFGRTGRESGKRSFNQSEWRRFSSLKSNRICTFSLIVSFLDFNRRRLFL